MVWPREIEEVIFSCGPLLSVGGLKEKFDHAPAADEPEKELT